MPTKSPGEAQHTNTQGDAPHVRLTREADYAARWRDGAWLGETLTTLDGERFTVVCQGRPGTGTGPDFRDAVLLSERGERICGDVEIHLRAANWLAHGHHEDRRYNCVALHVVIARGASDSATTRRQDGVSPPVAVLPMIENPTRRVVAWPCQSLGRDCPPGVIAEQLRSLGVARLHERAAAFRMALRRPLTQSSNALTWSDRDVTLWLALAEALGYGRDIETWRDIGRQMIAGPRSRPAMEQRISRLDARRSEGLRHWRDRWQVEGPWSALHALLWSGGERKAAHGFSRTLAASSNGAISPGRSAIVAVNVALPFALAVADSAEDTELARRVHGVYASTPGLPSNTITRLLARQFGLPRLPPGAQAQQGLHHVWARWCREKRCESCPLSTGIKTATRAGS